MKVMLSLNEQLQSTKTSHSKEFLQREIDSTGRQIDQLVYQLNNLTPAKIKIVEVPR